MDASTSAAIATSRIRVKFLSRYQAAHTDYTMWTRRFHGGIPSWGRCDYVFDQYARDYDWLVVYDDLPRRQINDRRPNWAEPLACARANTLLITSEPSSIKAYGAGFTHQFGHVLTSQEPWALRHKHVIRQQPGLIWYYGGASDRGTYDHLIATPPLAKTLDLSTVCSTKQMKHTLHHLRYTFTQRLKERFPQMDIFGHGVRPIDDKADAMDPYRYHLAIENHRGPHHWTEKLSDCYLAYCLPIYYGCTNLTDYFPEESFVAIDIENFEESCERLKKVIVDREYEQRLPAIIEARRLVLERYSTFVQLSNLIEKLSALAPAPTSAPAMLYSRNLLRTRRPWVAVQDGLDKLRSRFLRP